MKPILIAVLFAAACVHAADFSLQIANPVAVRTQSAKSASFAVRAVGCADPSKLSITATAEGLVAGERRSQKIPKLAPGPAPGTYLIYRQWPADGVWMVHLVALCPNGKDAPDKAAALVATGPQGVLRDLSKFFSRPATEPEVRSSLESLAEGGKQ